MLSSPIASLNFYGRHAVAQKSPYPMGSKGGALFVDRVARPVK